MYLKVSYDIEIGDQPVAIALRLAERLANEIVEFAEKYGLEATGIVEPLEKSDDQNDRS